MIDLELTDVQTAIGDSVDHYCRDRCGEDVVRAGAAEFPLGLWRGLADLGVLALASPEGEGGPVDVCVAAEALGRALFPGPIAATFMAGQALLDAERGRVTRGEALVSVGAPPLMPWAPLADYFLVVSRWRLYRAVPVGTVEPVDTVGGEPWGRVQLRRTAALGSSREPLQVYNIVLAAYLAAAGKRLLDLTCEHVRARKQFGRAIGEFQAVSHPLADCEIKLAGSATLARAAAFELGCHGADAYRTAAAARRSASRSALDTLHACHQAFGAMGVTIEGPVYPFTRRIRQLVSLPPASALDHDEVLEQFGM